ncbi:MAG: Ca2+-binding RTX toxin-like protein, partial [Myxococcota bacterium]
FDEGEPYTHRSQYLTAVTLTGDLDASIQGNDADNTLRGNVGDNTLNGGGGQDTVVYCGDRADYTVAVEGDAVILTGEGVDTLQAVEVVHFRDGAVDLTDLTSSQ